MCGGAWQRSALIGETRYFWLDDDQMISMRYGRNLAEGLGLVWNAGERVEGYSNFLWTLVMAAVHLLGASDAHAAAWIVAINTLLGCWLLRESERLLGELGVVDPRAVGALLIPLAIHFEVVSWAAHGFETTALTLVFTLTLRRVLRERESPRILTYILLGTLPLIRADAFGLMVACGAVALMVSQRPRRMVPLLVVAGLLPAAHIVFRLAYYGSLLPNTYYAKLSLVPWSHRAGVALHQLGVFSLHTAPAWVAACCADPARRAISQYRNVLGAGVAICVVQLMLVGPDSFFGTRFLAPWIPAVLALGIASTCGLQSDERPERLLVFAVGASILSAWFYVSPSMRVLDYTNGDPAASLIAGLAVRDNTDANASVAVHAAGVVPYFSRRPAVDWLGLTDPHVARLEPRSAFPGHSKYDYEHSFGALRPDVIVVTWWEPDVPGRCDPEYVRIASQREWVRSALLSEPFQTFYCGHHVESYPSAAIYLRSDSRRTRDRDRWRWR